MLQSVVTLLLIPCLLLNQSAALAHSHGASTGDGHSARAHIHLAGKSSASSHDDKHDHSHHGHAHSGHKHTADSHHAHSHGGHSHGHSLNDNPKCEIKGPTKKQKNETCSTPFQHDSDCVYLADVVATGLARTTVKVFQSGSLTSCVFANWNRTNLQRGTHEKWSEWPPPLLFGNCPRYLRNLSLLI